MTRATLHRVGARAALSFAATAVLTATAVSSAAAYTPPSAVAPGAVACVDGDVWREAVPGDYVCVAPAARSQAAYDNSQAATRRNPYGGPYGPDTCLSPYVWREATAGDRVCVTSATRDATAHDNAVNSSRQVSSRTYSVGFVGFDGPIAIGSRDGPIMLELDYNGWVRFKGKFHNSGFTSYNLGETMQWRAADGQTYIATHQGYAKGSWDCGLCPGDSGSRDDTWDKWEYNPSVRANWAAISRGAPDGEHHLASLDGGAIFNGVQDLIKYVQQVVGAVKTIVAIAA